MRGRRRVSRRTARSRAERLAGVFVADAASTTGLFVLAGAAAARGRWSRARVLVLLAAAVAPSVLLAALAVGGVAAAGVASRRSAARFAIGAVVAGDVLHTAAASAFLRRGSGIRGWARFTLVTGNVATALYLRDLLPEAGRAR